MKTKKLELEVGDVFSVGLSTSVRVDRIVIRKIDGKAILKLSVFARAMICDGWSPTSELLRRSKRKS